MLTDCQQASTTQAALTVSAPPGYGAFFCGGPILRWIAGQLINQRQELGHPSIQAHGRLPVEHFKRQSRSIQQPLKSTESRIPVNDLTGKRPPAVNQLECHIPDAWHMPRVRNVYREAVHSKLSVRKSPPSCSDWSRLLLSAAGHSWLTRVGRQPSVCSPDSWALWALVVFQTSAKLHWRKHKCSKMKSPPVHREQGNALRWKTYEQSDDLERFLEALAPFWNFGFPEMHKKEGGGKTHHKLNIILCSHNQVHPLSAIQLFHLYFFFFFWSKSSSSPHVSARDLACRQASLWLTHSSEWESFLPGGTVIPVKRWISFNVPVSNACQSKCQVLTSVITWMFHGWFLLFT